MIAGLLLDFYGTVVHEDDEIIAAICEEIAKASPATLEAREVARFWWATFSKECADRHGHTFRQQRDIERTSIARTLDEFGVALDPNLLSQSLFEHWRRPPIFDDAVAFLAGLHLPVCVISNIDRSDLESAIAHHGLAFDHVVTSEDVRSYKPRAELFRAGLDQLGLGAGAVLHVGDSLSSDVMGANALGIRVAWINRRRRSLPQHMTVERDVATLTDLESTADHVMSQDIVDTCSHVIVDELRAG